MTRHVGLTIPWALLLAACASQSRKEVQPGTVAIRDTGRASAGVNPEFNDRARCDFEGRDDRELNQTAGPGSVLPNVRRIYQILGTGDERRKVLVCREIDTNLDGVRDLIRTFNEKGESFHEEADANYDGRMDTWITFNNGRIQKESIDRNFDGKPDEWKYYVSGALSRIQRDVNGDGKPDIWEFYVQGHLERMGIDLDHDGHVDRWDHDDSARRAGDASDRAAERSNGAAKKQDSGGESSSPPAAASAGQSPTSGPDAAKLPAARNRKKLPTKEIAVPRKT